MARSKRGRTARRLVEPVPGPAVESGLPSWVGQVFGVALILGDFFLGRRLVESFDRFSDGGLTGIGDPFAWVMILGITGWWLVVLAWGRLGPETASRTTPATVGLAAVVVALVTAGLLSAMLGALWPVFRLAGEEGPNPVGIAFISGTLLALTAFQWWRLTDRDPVSSGEEEGRDRAKGPPGGPASEEPNEGEADPQAEPRAPVPPSRKAAPGVRLAAALVLLPAGWALLAPGDLMAVRAEAGISMNWQGWAGQLGAGALASVFSAGVGALFGQGPRALAARILGEGMSGGRFFLALWASHLLRMIPGVPGH